MKHSFVFLVVLALFSVDLAAHEMALNVNDAYARYEYQQSIRASQIKDIDDMQSKLDRLMADKKCTLQYTGPASGKINLEITELSDKIARRAEGVKLGDMRTNLTTKELESRYDESRKQYYNRLQNLSRMDSASISQMNLKPEVKDDLNFMRAIRDLSPEEKHRAIKAYEGRTFGSQISNSDKIAKAQLNGSKPAGETQVKVDGQLRTIRIAQGQAITMQTMSGAVISGHVIGVMPNGNVVLANNWSPEMKDLPNLARGRIVDLNQAATVNIRTSTGPTVELNVRPLYSQFIANARNAITNRPGPVSMTFKGQVLDKAASGITSTVLK